MALGTLLGSFVASFHFSRKLGHLFHLDRTLGPYKSDPRIRLVRLITRTQTFLVVIRMLSVLAAAAALPMTISITYFRTQVSLDRDIPAYVALAAVCTAIFAGLFFFFVEFFVRYNLEPKLGQLVRSGVDVWWLYVVQLQLAGSPLLCSICV